MINLTESSLRQFKMGKYFRECKKISSMDYSPDGLNLLVANNNEEVLTYNAFEGTLSANIPVKKYGVDLVRSTNEKAVALHTSTKRDHDIRLLNLHSKHYIRYFQGHTHKITSLSMSATNSTFLSSSLDRTVRLWDTRSPNCQGLLNLTGRPLVAYDPEGKTFVVCVDSHIIKLYNIETYDKAPFATYKIPQDENSKWTDVKLSMDCKVMLITTDGPKMHLLNALNCSLLHTLNKNCLDRVWVDASFSPDSQFLFSGSKDGAIHTWNVDTGKKICELPHNGHHVGPVRFVQFNPKMMMFASAGSELILWHSPPEESP